MSSHDDEGRDAAAGSHEHSERPQLHLPSFGNHHIGDQTPGQDNVSHHTPDGAQASIHPPYHVPLTQDNPEISVQEAWGIASTASWTPAHADEDDEHFLRKSPLPDASPSTPAIKNIQLMHGKLYTDQDRGHGSGTPEAAAQHHTDETTPLLQQNNDLQSSQQQQPPSYASLFSSISNSLQSAYSTTRSQISSEYGPGWQRLSDGAASSTTATSQWLRLKAAQAQEEASRRWMSMRHWWIESIRWFEERYTVEERNIACIALGILIFLLFLWIFAACVILGVPIVRDHRPVEPPARNPRPEPPNKKPAPIEPAPIPEPVSLCTTKDCVLTAGLILQTINSAVDPCDDFYQFTCGGWSQLHPLTVEGQSQTTYTLQKESINSIVKSILSSPYPTAGFATSEADRKIFSTVQSVYASCLNKTAVNARGVAPLASLIKEKLSADLPIVVPVFPGTSFVLRRDRLARALASVHSLGLGSLFTLTIEPSTTEKLRYVPVISPHGHLTFKKASMYNVPAHMAALTTSIDKVLSLIFDPPANKIFNRKILNRSYKALAAEVAAFEAKLAAITPSAADIAHGQTFLSTGELKLIAPSIEWFDYLELRFNSTRHAAAANFGGRVSGSGPTVVVKGGREYLAAMSAIVAESTAEVLDTYLIWRIIVDYSPFVDGEVEEAVAKVVGRQAVVGSQDRCVRAVGDVLSDAVGNVFVKLGFEGSAHSLAADVFENVKLQLSRSLSRYSWIDEDTLPFAQSKVDQVLVIPAIDPASEDSKRLLEQYRDLVNYTENADDMQLFESIVAARSASVTQELTLISGPIDFSIVDCSVLDTKTSYSVSRNNIFAPAGLLQHPHFSTILPYFWNYGSTASLFAHDLVHSIDEIGSQRDPNGLIRDWQSAKSRDKYKKLADCFIDQFSNYTVQLPNNTVIHLDGVKGQISNVADTWGLKVAFDAWWADRRAAGGAKRNPLLPGLETFSVEQMFFIGFAARECANENAKDRIRSVLHGQTRAPGDYRVNGAVSNSVEFSKAFGCLPGSPMNPVKKCQIR